MYWEKNELRYPTIYLYVPNIAFNTLNLKDKCLKDKHFEVFNERSKSEISFLVSSNNSYIVS